MVEGLCSLMLSSFCTASIGSRPKSPGFRAELSSLLATRMFAFTCLQVQQNMSEGAHKLRANIEINCAASQVAVQSGSKGIVAVPVVRMSSS